MLRDERLRIAQQWAAGYEDLAVDLPLVHEFLERSIVTDQAASERLSEAVARRSLAINEQDPEHSLLLAVAAVEECAATRLAQRALLAALATLRIRGLLRGHGDVVRSVRSRLTATALQLPRTITPHGFGTGRAVRSSHRSGGTSTGCAA